MKKALICGVFGQDGSYLAELLLEKGYRVFGTSRDPGTANRSGAVALGVADRIDVLPMIPTDFSSVLAALAQSEPDEIYALAGQSSVGQSFHEPAETMTSIVSGTLNLLEAIRATQSSMRLYNASSAECFGDLKRVPAVEKTPFHPRSPYGVAKASAHMMVATYRESFGLFAANGILFNHESPLRPARFVTRKITGTAKRIAAGSAETLRLGRLDIVRDWGWAPEYVEAMWRTLQQDRADDYIIATGCSRPLAEFVEAAFATFGLDWRDHVLTDPAIGRPYDSEWSGADPSYCQQHLGWSATTRMPDVARMMAAAEGSLG